MSNGGWNIVLVIIMLGIIAGILGTCNYYMNQQDKIDQAALHQVGEKLAMEYAKETEIAGQRQNLEDKLATATAVNGELDRQMEVAQTEQAQAKATIVNQQATIAAMNGRIPVVGGSAARDTAVSGVRATQVGMPVTSENDKERDGISWLPGLVLGFFVLVVAAAYRMLKIEDRTQRQAS